MNNEKLIDGFTEILPVHQILIHIGVDAIRGLTVPELRKKRKWAQDYIKWLDDKSEALVSEMETLDPVVDKRAYKSIDADLYLVADTMPVVKNSLIDIEHEILCRSSLSIFSTGKGANMKALNHGGVYMDADTRSYCGKRNTCHRSIMKGVTL